MLKPVPGILDAVELVAGGFQSCARTMTGSVRCWGYVGNAAMGPFDQTQATEASGLSLGNSYACATFKSGALRCWGENTWYQLAANDFSTDHPLYTVFNSSIASVTASRNHTCAITTWGLPVCWGKNGSGELGNGRGSESSVILAVVAASPS